MSSLASPAKQPATVLAGELTGQHPGRSAMLPPMPATWLFTMKAFVTAINPASYEVRSSLSQGTNGATRKIDHRAIM